MIQPSEKVQRAQRIFAERECAMMRNYNAYLKHKVTGDSITDQLFDELVAEVAKDVGVEWVYVWDDEAVVAWRAASGEPWLFHTDDWHEMTW